MLDGALDVSLVVDQHLMYIFTQADNANKTPKRRDNSSIKDGMHSSSHANHPKSKTTEDLPNNLFHCTSTPNRGCSRLNNPRDENIQILPPLKGQRPSLNLGNSDEENHEGLKDSSKGDEAHVHDHGYSFKKVV